MFAYQVISYLSSFITYRIISNPVASCRSHYHKRIIHSIIRTIVISFVMRTLVIEWFTVIGGSNQYHRNFTSSYHQHGLFISLPLLYDFILSSDNFLCYHLIIVSLLVVIFVNSYQYVSYHFYLFIVDDCECMASWQILPYFCIVSYHIISSHNISSINQHHSVFDVTHHVSHTYQI